jgi:hypothetical protein
VTRPAATSASPRSSAARRISRSSKGLASNLVGRTTHSVRRPRARSHSPHAFREA